MAGPAAPSERPLLLTVLEVVIPGLASLGMSGWGRGRRGRAGVETHLPLRIFSHERTILGVEVLYLLILPVLVLMSMSQKEARSHRRVRNATYREVISMTLSSNTDCFKDRFKYW